MIEQTNGFNEKNIEISEKNAEIDDFYEESVEKTKNIINEAISKGYTIGDDDRKVLELVKANEQFAEKVLSGEDYQDLQDFCDGLTVAKVRYINEQIAKGNNKTSFVKKLADIAKDGQLAEELRSKPLSKFKEEVSELKQGLHRSNKATAIPTNYKYSDVPSSFEEEFKQVQNYFRTRGVLMPITSDSSYYRTTLLSQRLIELVLFSSPLLAFTGSGADDIPSRYSGKDSFLIQPPFVSTQGGLISDDRFMDEKDGIHTVKQKTMRIDYKRVSGAAKIDHDDVKFLFNRDQFPSNVPTSLTSFMERGERAYHELLMKVIKQINDYQFKTIASRAFICAGSTEDKMYDCIEGYMRLLIDYMIRVNGGVMRTSRLVGSMPNSAMGVLRTKSGLNYTQAPKSDMFLSDTKNMLSSLMFDLAELYIDTSTYFHKAGEASKKESIMLEKIDKAIDEYHSMTATFSEGSFKKGDIIQLEDKEWLARDRKDVPSGVPIALTVMEDTDEKTVKVSPGITYGVDVPNEDYLKGAKGKVAPDHCKAFLWWQPASIFKMSTVPAPSTSKYNYKEISAPNAAFGPSRSNSMSFATESRFVLERHPQEIGELMAYLYSDFFNFFVGTLILPPKSPKPETYIKTIKNLSTEQKEEKQDE